MFLGSQHLEGKGACWSFRMGLGRMTRNHPLTWTCTNQTTSWLVHSQNTLVLGRTMSKLKLTRLTTAQTQGKSSPSPLQYTLCLVTGLAPKCHFVPGLPSGSPEMFITRTPTTLEAHNFAYVPLIEMRSKAKLQPWLKAFQRYVTCHMHTRKLG